MPTKDISKTARDYVFKPSVYQPSGNGSDDFNNYTGHGSSSSIIDTQISYIKDKIEPLIYQRRNDEALKLFRTIYGHEKATMSQMIQFVNQVTSPLVAKSRGVQKTFNLSSYLSKFANLSYEGSQGYFLAQRRAWMNCVKCGQEDGKSAQEAWQKCFDEFQTDERKLSWLENYAKDNSGNMVRKANSDKVEALSNSEIEGWLNVGLLIGSEITGKQQKTAQSLSVPETREEWLQYIETANSSSVLSMARKMPKQFLSDVDIAKAYKIKTGLSLASNP